MSTHRPRVLLVDNYDSYTYNLHDLLAVVSGAPPEVRRNDALVELDWSDPPYDAIVLSPGPGRPDRAADFGGCAALIRSAPVALLGVCLGHQGLAQVYGGAVRRGAQPMHGRISEVEHTGDALFDGLPSPFRAVRYHSLVVDPELPAELLATAWSHDGALMGLRHRELPQWGVQFHPESICTEHGHRLLRNFLQHARTRPGPPPRRPRARPEPAGTLHHHLRVLPSPVDPERAFVHLYADAPTAFWLDSASTEAGRFSFLGDASGPHAFTLQHDVRTGESTLSGAVSGRSRQPLFDLLRDLLRARAPVHPPDLPFDLDGGFVGYLGYELKAACDGEPGPASPHPDAHLLFADRLIVHDHHTHTTTLLCLAPADDPRAQAWLDATSDRLAHLPPLPAPSAAELPPGSFTLDRSPAQHLRDVHTCQRWLRDGESYELCLTNQLRSPRRADPLQLHRRLRALNPAPYAALLRLGPTAIVCASPERFLRVSRDRTIESRPIKGTLPRGLHPADDDRLANQLATTEKFRAENLMIVDLVRNDLSRVCEPGTVHVPQLMTVERHPTVLQLVSTVRGTLRDDLHATDAVRAAFPGGSMTGAPKRRSMSLLDQLEGRARGVYSGAIGYFALCGAADLNIVIRTAVLDPTGTSIGTGGAITALSDPQDELDELWLKTRALLRAIEATPPQQPPDELRV